ncbi:GTP cyclohydrolase II [Patescibacteria group bacterium]|nr:GTP cyclohydrolase II [Patescibacteria group bacterium]
MCRDMYILFGPPGSGKTVQARFLSQRLKLDGISWGDIYWGTKFNKKYKGQIAVIKKEAISDRTRSKEIAKIIDKEIGSLTLRNKGGKRGLVLDGFPRRLGEARLLLKICKKRGYRIKSLIRINPSLDFSANRFKKRLFCEKCRAYYDELNLPKKKGRCDLDGGRLSHMDISKESVAKEFNTYLDECLETFEYLKDYADIFFDVTGDDEDMVISSNILIKIKNRIRENYSLFSRKPSTSIMTKYGSFKLVPYQSRLDYSYHLALVKGNVRDGKRVLVRVHSSCITGDIFGSYMCDCGEQLEESMKRIEHEKRGVLIYLFQEGRGINMINKIQAYRLQRNGYDTVDANEAIGFPAEMRDYRLVKEVLEDLGVKTIRLLSNSPEKINKLTDQGVIIEEMVGVEVEPRKWNRGYLLTKKEKMGHKLDVS